MPASGIRKGTRNCCVAKSRLARYIPSQLQLTYCSAPASDKSLSRTSPAFNTFDPVANSENVAVVAAFDLAGVEILHHLGYVVNTF
jgi:hypothetical protein